MVGIIILVALAEEKVHKHFLSTDEVLHKDEVVDVYIIEKLKEHQVLVYKVQWAETEE